MSKKDLNKPKTIQEFVESIDNMKKLNPKDLSSDQDLSIAIMNLISIEEHLIFSGAKTGKTSFYDLVSQIRELRKNLMQKMIKEYEGEVWCISKHLLGASYRLMEVGTKQQSMGNTAEAYDLFDKAYELYCLFWGLNMNIIDTKGISWANDDSKNVENIKKHLDEYKVIASKTSVKSDISKSSEPKAKSTGAISKLKDAVKKAVNCCIE